MIQELSARHTGTSSLLPRYVIYDVYSKIER
jgi:hypothetical protein